MFKYKNVMIALFVLFFFSTLVHLVYSCLVLEPQARNAALICDGALFLVPLAVFISGKLRRAMPYILVAFYVVSCFVMSAINGSMLFLPLLFTCAVVSCGFFLSVKLCVWLTVLSDIVLIGSFVFFSPEEIDPFVLVYVTMCICCNFSCLAMILFVFAVRRNLVQLRRKNKELAASGSRKSAFWAAAASQMRSSSERLYDFCGTRLKDGDLPEHVRKEVETIRNDTKRLMITLNDAEDYARIENKGMEIRRVPYSFGDLIGDVSESCSALMRESVSLTVDCQPDIPSVLVGDDERIFQVVMHLFENAVKHTESGDITIAFSSRKTVGGVNLQIRVRDTGTGFTDDAAQKIFTVYAEKRGRSLSAHLGLGLVKELVTLMGGFIYVRREAEGGTCFVITLPQEVKDPTPFAEIKNREKINVLLYAKEKSKAERTGAQLEKMGVSSRICLSRAEFGFMSSDPEITHIFTDYQTYCFDKPVFQILSRRVLIVTVCGADEGEAIMPKNITRLTEPLNMASIVHVLNDISVDTAVKDVNDPDFDPLTDIHYDDPRR
ncbi:MAG: HAMP domain-containing histidine kinase [Bacteroides sp.]|nr:HAMP domain-containing histidine kinase [Bacteroides sp.]